MTEKLDNLNLEEDEIFTVDAFDMYESELAVKICLVCNMAIHQYNSENVTIKGALLNAIISTGNAGDIELKSMRAELVKMIAYIDSLIKALKDLDIKPAPKKPRGV